MHWLSESKVEIDNKIRGWLFHRESMTERLRSCCQNAFRVDVLSHKFTCPTEEEAAYLNLNTTSTVIAREVMLCCDNEPWMYAKTIIPESTVSNVGDDLLHLGSRPIGEVLFSDPNLSRSHFEFAKVVQGDDAYRHACGKNKTLFDFLWARRSIFSMPEKGELSITEVFLPVCWQR